MTITITLNGRPERFDAPLSLENVLERAGFAGKNAAAAVNGAFVPQSAHADHMLADGDTLEILAPMQGG